MTSRAPDRLAVASALREMAARLQASAGDNRYRARAYERAARSLERFPGDFAQLVAEGRLTAVPGVGEGIAAVIQEIVRTGSSGSLEKLRKAMPSGGVEMLRLPGFSRERLSALQQGLDVKTLDELREAAEAGRVRELRGFGPAAEQKLLDAISALETTAPALHLHKAEQDASELISFLKAAPRVTRVERAGVLRRRVE